jgi:hypothetical protein
VRLATNFLLAARLPNARLVNTDKPVALASFKAVWRSEDAAGAVKIIPPGRDITGIGIASDLIAVDPKLCKGDFAATRSHDVVDGAELFKAVLSCADGHDRLTTQYFITPHQPGGFVVFAVIASNAVAAVDGQKAELFGKAAVHAAGAGD